MDLGGGVVSRQHNELLAMTKQRACSYETINMQNSLCKRGKKVSKSVKVVKYGCHSNFNIDYALLILHTKNICQWFKSIVAKQRLVGKVSR
jgi:hypothetical protein